MIDVHTERRAIIALARTDWLARAYALMAMAFCGQKDIANANGMIRNVPRALKRAVYRFCRRKGVTFGR